jgi:hypothetical protein
MANTSFTLKNRLALIIIACLTGQSILPLSAAPAKATSPPTVIQTMDWTFLFEIDNVLVAIQLGHITGNLAIALIDDHVANQCAEAIIMVGSGVSCHEDECIGRITGRVHVGTIWLKVAAAAKQ